MLAKSYRISVDNQSGAGLSAVGVFVTPWKFDDQGAVAYQSQETPALTAPADNAQADSDAIDNTTTKAIGAHCRVTFTGGGANDVYVYLQSSEDGTNWATVYSVPVATITGPSGGAVEFEI